MAPPRPIAFLFPAFPVLHQTFVLWEVLALRERGIAIELFSIKRPSTRTQQPEGEALAREVHYLPSPLSPAVLAANLKVFRRSPRRYAAAFVGVVGAWWRDRAAGRAWQRRRVSEAAPDREQTFGEFLRGRFNRSPFLYLLKSLWLVPRAAYLGEVLAARGIGHVHAHWASYSATVALVVHRLFGVPFSFTAHAYDIYLVPRLLAAKVEEAAFVVTCARINRDFLASLAGETAARRIVVNYHGVSLARFRPATRAPKADTPCVLTCGRLEPYKGHHVTLRAVAALPFAVRCVVVGEGPQRRRLERIAADLGIGERVEFTGPVSQGRLVELLGCADVFVLASIVLERSGKRDVIPNVLVEAMAMRIPVVASDVSGIGELVTDGVSGRLVRPNDPRALAAAVAELLRDHALRERLARGGYEKVAADFDREKNIEALAALFAGRGELVARREADRGSLPRSARGRT